MTGRKVAAGDGLVIAAADWNAALDAADAFRGAGRDGLAGLAAKGVVPACVVLVKNTSGANWSRWAAVRLGAPVDSTLSTDAGAVSRRPILTGTVPTTAEQPCGVLLEAVANGEIGRAAVAGFAVATVSVGSTAHQYAAPTASQVYLTSNNTFGPISLLGTPAGTGTQTCAVLLGWLPPTVLTTVVTAVGNLEAECNEEDDTITVTADVTTAQVRVFQN